MAQRFAEAFDRGATVIGPVELDAAVDAAVIEPTLP
jgi:hypothetical protein